MNKPIYILGINGSVRASAALLKNGEIVAAALEERFTRIKNQAGFPKNAIAYCLKEAGINSKELSSIWISFLHNPTLFVEEKDYKDDLLFSLFSKVKPYFTGTATNLIYRFPKLHKIYELRKSTFLWTLLKNQQLRYLALRLKVSEKIINLLDHHYAHGFAAYYSNLPAGRQVPSLPSTPSLIITLDGGGDKVCSRIFIVQSDNWKQVASTPNEYSIGWLYWYVTEYLGMKPDEDEYKVMGLAPYAHPHEADKVFQLLKSMMWVEGLSVKSSIPRVVYPSFLKKNLAKFRFDAIAGGIQRLTEELICELIQNAIKKTNIHSLVVGGGVFMNVKANMKIAQLKGVKNLWVCPSSTDDSTALGAAYFGYKQYCSTHKISFNPKPLKDLYLGPSYPIRHAELVSASLNQIPKPAESEARHRRRVRDNITLHKLRNSVIEIAKLLAAGHIVARFSGRMEFGARALGSRSILADPRNITVIKIINDMIKMRDFWMPFTPTILWEAASKYLINPKHINSPYMMLAFETTKRAQTDIPATLHPYDQTCRPQILKKEDNPGFYEIIKEFEKLTGIPAVLNTSFNLHGEPIVCTPEDALDTFLKSGLEYLVIEDYLISKVFISKK